MATRLQRLRRDALHEVFPLAGPSFRRAAPWLMAAVLLAGLAARLHPALRYAVWGSDSGEYIFLTGQLVETGRVLFAYEGWGIAYPYFPGMFVVSGATTAVLGVDVFRATLLVVPVLAATLPVLVGLVAYRVSSDPRAGVLAAAFVAVTAPAVIVTSHAMPHTLGQIFLLGILALLPAAQRDPKHLILYGVLGIALVLTHHLSTYFAVGILAFTPFYREMGQRTTDWARVRIEVPLGLGILALALVWWLGVAGPFRERIVGDALDLNPWLTAAGFLGALFSLPLLVWLKRRHFGWIRRPRYPSFLAQRARILGAFLGVLAVVFLLVFVKLPGTNMELGWPTIFYVIPVLGWISFVPLGTAVIHFHKGGHLVSAWLYAILASLLFAVVTESHVLFPFRHVDYLIEAMAPLAALGMLMTYDQAIASRVPSERPRTRLVLLTVFCALLVTNAATSLPPRETIGGFEEGITDAEWAAVQWVADFSGIEPGTPFAADHRISSLLWGVAQLHATWDYTPRTYHAEDPDEVFAELAGAKVPARGEDPTRVDYVFLSPEIEAGVTLLQWENSAPMSAAAVAKFEDERYFEKLYDVDGVRVYRLKWEDYPPPAVACPDEGAC